MHLLIKIPLSLSEDGESITGSSWTEERRQRQAERLEKTSWAYMFFKHFLLFYFCFFLFINYDNNNKKYNLI